MILTAQTRIDCRTFEKMFYSSTIIASFLIFLKQFCQNIHSHLFSGVLFRVFTVFVGTLFFFSFNDLSCSIFSMFSVTLGAVSKLEAGFMRCFQHCCCCALSMLALCCLLGVIR